MNNSLAETRIDPRDRYKDAWYQDHVDSETHIDFEADDAGWIDDAKDRTHSIISNLETEADHTTASHLTPHEDPVQLQNFYDSEVFASRFGQESATPGKHATSTITEGQQADFAVCSCCQLRRAPSSDSTLWEGLPASPVLHHKLKDACCECFCPDTKMPQENEASSPRPRSHVRRRSSLSAEGLAERAHENRLKERQGREEMSVGAWL